MTNIIGGNAGKIQHFDQGPDGLIADGANKGHPADFFQLISSLGDSSIELEKPSDANKAIPTQEAGHLSPNKMINVDERNINSSTLSQLRGIINSPVEGSDVDTEIKLKGLLSTISLE
ncbi:MAG: hypothetical protein CL842_05800, partial [Crocinitomicaceae bacterium]|nr:hypothetical protein [Crocinitomicaceae bacterium]